MLESRAAALSETLPRSFFERDAVVVARALIGTRIVFGSRIARIVETEAYRGPKDLACHARVGITNRTRPLFGEPGTAYVYFVYGMHECFNIVCNALGSGNAVLIRAAEPLAGFAEDERTDGPGRFARAMKITREHNGLSLHEKKSKIVLLPKIGRIRIATSPRVGVGYSGEWADKPWRFFEMENRWVSKPPKSAIGRGT